MKRPFVAYEGDEPYVFVCYAHEDAQLVYPEIQRLHEGGIPIWYDEGVSPGSRWSDELARKLSAASLVLFFCTARSVKSQHCQDEINFALDDKRPLLVVQDGEVELPPGLRLRLNAHQSILKHELSADQFVDKLTAAISRHVGRGARVAPAIPKSRRRLRYVVGVAVVVVLATALWRLWPHVLPAAASTNVEYTVAVLPFRALSSEPVTVTFAQALSDELVNELSGPMPAKVRAMFPPLLYPLRVVPARSTLRYRDTNEDLATIGRSLGAGYLVEGGVRSAGDEVRVTVQLVHAADNEPVWSRSYDAPANAPLQAQTDIVRHAARRIAWFVPDMYQQSRSMFSSAAAFDVWYRGNRAQMDWFTGGDVDIPLMLANLERALELEPGYPWIYENVSLTYLLMMENSMEPVPMVAPIEEMLNTASALLESGVPPVGLDQLHFDMERAQYALQKLDYASASRYVRAALAHNPGDSWALDFQGRLFLHQERPDDALASFRRTVEILGTSPITQLALARLLRARGQTHAAIKSLDSALDFYPGELGKAQLLIEQANAYRLVGNAERAATLVDQAWDLCGTNHPDLFPAALATTGRSDRARAILNDLEVAGHGRRFNPLDMIEGYAALGDLDGALRWMNRAIDAPFEPVVRWMHLVTVSSAGIWPIAMTTDPRWQQAYARLPKVDGI